MRKIDQFKIKATVEVDTKEASENLDELSDKAQGTSGKLGNLGNEGEKSSGKLGKFFSSFGKGAATVAKWTAAGIGAASTAIAGVTVKALSAAGELEQNMGGSEAVFGEFADKIQAKAKEAFSNMGLSTSDYLATANKMGSLFQGAGFETEKAMTMSQDAMQRAADVASIMGIDTASAMEAIAGAAKGNFTMMDNLGVAMNDTTLQAYALEKGIKKSTTEMTNQEKIGLAMEMFMEKTAYAAGNYAKENETLAGSLGTAKAAFSNFLSGAGSVDDVVSSFSNLAEVVVKNIDEMFPKLMTGFTQIVEKIVPLIPPLLQKVLPGIIAGATGLINGLVAALPAILDALMGALPALIQGIQTIINALIGALPQIMQSLVGALPTLIPMLVDALVSIIVTLCTNFAQIIQPLIDALPDIIIGIVEALMNNLPVLIEGLISLVIGIVAAIPQIIQALIIALPDVVAAIIEGLINCLPQLITGLTQLAISLAVALPQILVSLMEAIPAIFLGILKAIVGVFLNLPALLGKIFEGAMDSAVHAWSTIKQAFTDKLNAIKAVFGNIGGWFKEKFNSAKNNVVNAWAGVKAKFTSIKNGIVNAFSNIKEKLSAPFTKARDTIKGIADKIKGFFKGEISMPKIKMPHFSIKPSGWKIGDLLKGSIPKLGIDWYAKAMNNPMLMTKPTIFGYNAETGNWQGGGEAGSEMVGGTNTIMGMISNAVASQNNVIVVYLQRLIEILATYFPQILEAAGHDIVANDGTILAHYLPQIDEGLGKIKTRKDKGR